MVAGEGAGGLGRMEGMSGMGGMGRMRETGGVRIAADFPFVRPAIQTKVMASGTSFGFGFGYSSRYPLSRCRDLFSCPVTRSCICECCRTARNVYPTLPYLPLPRLHHRCRGPQTNRCRTGSPFRPAPSYFTQPLAGARPIPFPRNM